MDKETPKKTDQENTLQKTAVQRKTVQKKTEQENTVQKTAVQKKTVQKTEQENTGQKAVAQKKTVQKTEATKAVQKKAVQKTGTKNAVQKKTGQRTAVSKKTTKAGSKKELTGVKKKQKTRRIISSIRLGLALLAVFFVMLVVIKLVKPSLLTEDYFEVESEKVDDSMPDIDVQLLTVNPYSRPGTKTEKIAGIVMHYTANPGATAIANRNYFEGLKDSHITKSSSNFIVGLDGEIVQCVPTWEMAYASNERNIDTVSIECCHPDESGVFFPETYQSMVKLCAWLCLKFDLSEKDIIRHYDVTEKICPKYFVEDEEAWETFRKDVKKAMKKAG